jgi:DNA-damage-inducible protein D
MKNSITVSGSLQENNGSPFDSIRHYDEKGNEWWSARDLQKMLGYVKWQMFENSIQLGLENLESAVGDISTHALLLEVTLKSQKTIDYRLSRIACYHIALACDSRGKPNVKAAKHYFAVKTREAEVIIPAQNDRIRELELEVRALELRKAENDRQDFRLGAYGLSTTLLLEGKADSVVEVDRPILEVIDHQSGVKFSGQTTKQLADYLNRNGGRSFKSGAELERELNRLGRADLIDTVPRKSLQPFISKENLAEACRVLVSSRQQQLL